LKILIHLIYIYFVVNAFLSGIFFDDNKAMSFTLLFCGIPLYILIFCWLYIFKKPIFWIENNLLLLGWYRLFLTNYFAQMDNQTIDIRKKQYFGFYKNSSANKYQRFFLRQLDKKYNYGITKKDLL